MYHYNYLILCTENLLTAPLIFRFCFLYHSWVPILIVVLVVFILVLVTSVVLAVLMYPREVTISKINATELRSFIHYKPDQVNVSDVTLELSVSQ